MTHQEYYEKFFRINGQAPPPLNDWDKELFALYDFAVQNPNVQGIQIVWGKNMRRKGYLLKCVSEKAAKDIKNNYNQ